MKEENCRVLEDGRVYVDYGPVSMVIMARNGKGMMTELAYSSFPVISRGLEELAAKLSFLRRYPGEIDEDIGTGLAGGMLAAVRAVGEPTLTPMAAIAGAMSDLVADWLFEQGADAVVVNNGGDIALRLIPEESVRMGILPDIRSSRIDEVVTISGRDGIGGVCTSGLGGRSLTRGIANAVTVFSGRCVQADACATHIANCSYIVSPRVRTARAGDIQPGSDIADLTVVTEVGDLHPEEIRRGLAQIEGEIKQQAVKGNLLRAAADIKGRKIHYNVPGKDHV